MAPSTYLPALRRFSTFSDFPLCLLSSITQSPVYMAALGLVSPARGLSLRFPRFIRLREDKGTIDASTPEFLASLWRKQENKGSNSKGIDDGELVDVSPEASEVEEDAYE